MLWIGLVTGLVVVASYVSLGRYFVGYVEQYQQELVNRFIDFTGLSLTVGHLHGHWSKLSPVLTMEQLALYRPGEEGKAGAETVLTISNVSFQLDPLSSLFSGTLKVKALTINNVHCAIEEIQPGRWQLQGYPIASGGDTNFDNVIDLILSVERVALFDAELTSFYASGDDSLLTIEEVSLNRRDDFRRLRLNAFVDQLSGPVVAVVESIGDPREQSVFSAQAYLNVDNVDFSALLSAAQARGVELKNAAVDSELWLDWQPGAQVSVQGFVTMPVVDIGAISGELLAPLEDVKFGFRAEKTSTEDWHIWLPTLETNWNGEHFNFNQSQIIRSLDGLELALPAVDIGTVSSQLLAADMLSDKAVDVLATMAPSGWLKNVKLQLPRQPSAAKSSENRPENSSPAFRLQANVENAALSAWRGAPGASGVSGYLEMTPARGLVELESKNMTLAFPGVYEQPMDFDTVIGQVGWDILPDRVLVDSSPLYLTADHGPATALLDLDIPLVKTADNRPEMTLTVGLKDTDAKYRSKFIPSTLSRNFLDWMSVSVPSGHVVDGGFIFRGSLNKGDSEHRTVQLYLNVDDTHLAYHPDWPILTAIEGLVEVSDLVVEVSADKAKMYELDVAATAVRVAPLKEGGLWLTVDTAAKGSATDALRVVNDSVISQMVGNVFQRWQLAGEAAATVTLGIPLAGAVAQTDIDVAVELSGAALKIPEYRLAFDHINGPVSYNSIEGIRSPNLKAHFYQKPVVVNVLQKADKATQIDMNGRIDMRDVQAWSGQPALDFTEGETDFEATINIRPNTISDLSIRSHLVGVAIDLPAPYGKAKKQPRDFWLRLPIAAGNPLLSMGMSTDIDADTDTSVAEQAELQLQLVNGSVGSGLLILDQTDDRRHQENVLLVTGRVDSFVLEEWEEILNRYMAAERQINSASDPLAKAAGGLQATPVDARTDENNPLSIGVKNLRVSKFYGFSLEYENSVVNLQRRNEAWWLSASNEEVVGSITFPDDSDLPMVAKLDSLLLKNLDSSRHADNKPLGLSSFSRLNINVDIDRLSIDDQVYGALAFEARGNATGVRFNHIVGEIRGITLGKEEPAMIEWLNTADGEETRFQGHLKMASMGDVLENWNYERIIESESATSSLDLTWPGSPDQWQLSSSRGPLKLSVNKGRFLRTSNSASGTMKVVGIVNFTNIIRRLQLDFSDLYESGIGFDRIEGEALLGEGKLKIIDNLTVKTPSSSFYLRGNADLLEKELDMELIATLPLASNLPWIAALAGGLPTAAGIYVASLLFEDQVDRLSSAIYRVDGDWNNPDLSFKRVFDDR